MWAYLFQDSDQEVGWEKEKEEKKEWGGEGGNQQAGMAVALWEALIQKGVKGERPTAIRFLSATERICKYSVYRTFQLHCLRSFLPIVAFKKKTKPKETPQFLCAHTAGNFLNTDEQKENKNSFVLQSREATLTFWCLIYINFFCSKN